MESTESLLHLIQVMPNAKSSIYSSHLFMQAEMLPKENTFDLKLAITAEIVLKARNNVQLTCIAI